MHNENYGNSILNDKDIIPRAYLDRMQFVRDEGCNSMILTGTAEPQQNLPFIYKLLISNRTLRTPFYNISIQTTGSNLHPEDIKNLADAGVTTLALSISSFDDERNWNIINTPQNARTMTITELIQTAKLYNLNVRASFNLTNEFNRYKPGEFFIWGKNNYIDQITFRKIYASGDSKQAQWVEKHKFFDEKLGQLKNYIQMNGVPISRLPYGFIQYSVKGISTVIDDNCMSKDNIDEIKYAILRPNGHLYSRWDDTGSLIF